MTIKELVELNFKIAETHETHETHKYRHIYIHIKKK